jgi:hypothetical protein
MIPKVAADADEDLNWKQSIVDLMKLLKLDSSLNARKQLAQELGYTGALSGSAEMKFWASCLWPSESRFPETETVVSRDAVRMSLLCNQTRHLTAPLARPHRRVFLRYPARGAGPDRHPPPSTGSPPNSACPAPPLREPNGGIGG